MKKGCIGLGFASPNTTFFMDPIYFRIPPVKHCITNNVWWCKTQTAERNSMKLERKQYLNVLYQVFRADPKTKMAALVSDWMRQFRLL